MWITKQKNFCFLLIKWTNDFRFSNRLLWNITSSVEIRCAWWRRGHVSVRKTILKNKKTKKQKQKQKNKKQGNTERPFLHSLSHNTTLSCSWSLASRLTFGPHVRVAKLRLSVAKSGPSTRAHFTRQCPCPSWNMFPRFSLQYKLLLELVIIQSLPRFDYEPNASS